MRLLWGSRGRNPLTPAHIHRTTTSTVNHVLGRSEPEVGEEHMTAVLAAKDVLWFDVAMRNPVFVTVLDCRKYLQECIADLVFLRSVVVGSDRSEKIAAAVKVEDEKISGKSALDAMVTEADVGVEGDCVGDVFVSLDVLLGVELLGRTVCGL
jgi:hypothetical protein